jgi:hypothetical protein
MRDAAATTTGMPRLVGCVMISPRLACRRIRCDSTWNDDRDGDGWLERVKAGGSGKEAGQTNYDISRRLQVVACYHISSPTEASFAQSLRVLLN